MKIEQMYYENPNLWTVDKYKEAQAVRASITKQWLPKTIASVLDVGCGNGVITNMLDQFAVGVDRSWATLGYLHVPHCQADVVHLPFSSISFDAVISTEVIEHLPYESYKQALAEMVRVSRQYILITVPYQEDLISAQIMCPACNCRFHPNFHMRTFAVHDLAGLFFDFPSVQVTRVAGIMETTSYRSNTLRKEILRCLAGNAQRNTVNFQNRICPSCGYSEKSETNNALAPSLKTRNLGSILGKTINTFWPRQLSYRWWMALYTKL